MRHLGLNQYFVRMAANAAWNKMLFDDQFIDEPSCGQSKRTFAWSLEWKIFSHRTGHNS
jgi:hypothetical protein